MLNRLLDFNGTLDNLFKPQTDYEYFLLKSCFFPIIEFMNWTSSKNKKYSKTVIDRIFHNETDLNVNGKLYRTNVYNTEYKNKKFFIFTDINSTKTQFNVLNFEEAEKILSNYYKKKKSIRVLFLSNTSYFQVIFEISVVLIGVNFEEKSLFLAYTFKVILELLNSGIKIIGEL